MRLAEQALREGLQPDYRRPFEPRPPARARASELYLEACRAGDKPSCWLAMTLASVDGWRAAASLVDRNCRAGDVMSCRALPAERRDVVFAGAPGEVGRSWRCSQFNPAPECDVLQIAEMRSECAVGFVASCWNLEFAKPPLPDRKEIGARIAELARVGCEAGIVDDCHALAMHDPDDPARLADDRLCTLVGERCSQRAAAHQDPLQVRETLERGCQHHPRSPEVACLELGRGYLSEAYPEPVVGRGQALVDWACRRVAGLPGCELATSE